MNSATLEPRIRDIARRRKPRGWRIVERQPRHGALGMATRANRIIYVPPLKSLASLFIYLHEVAHVVNRHLHGIPVHEEFPHDWEYEFEAERWAIDALRAEGFSVPRAFQKAARENVRHRIEEAVVRHDFDIHHEDFNWSALKFAFPETWRSWA
jgi:hypothetical protein